jgi:hypothetical protein
LRSATGFPIGRLRFGGSLPDCCRRAGFDAIISETSKNSEFLLKLAGDIFQPISDRFAVAAEKLKTAA